MMAPELESVAAGGEEIAETAMNPLAIGDSITLRDSSNQTQGDSFLYASQKLRSRAFVQSPAAANPIDNFHKSVFEVSSTNLRKTYTL